MRTKSLREIQQQGEKAISGFEPFLITSRKGPLGVLMPVSVESLSYVQKEMQKIAALESLRNSWNLSKENGLDKLSDAEIQKEVKLARKERLKAKKKQSGQK